MGESDSDRVWIEYKRQAMEESIPFCAQVMDSKTISQCLRLLTDHFDHFPPVDGPCLLHNDYRIGNILVRGEDVVGMIDFEIAGGGSADVDFCLIKAEVWDRFPGTKESFLAGYQTIRMAPNLERSLPFYELHQALTRIAWCVRRAKTNEAFYYDFLRQIDRLVQTQG